MKWPVSVSPTPISNLWVFVPWRNISAMFGPLPIVLAVPAVAFSPQLNHCKVPMGSGLRHVLVSDRPPDAVKAFFKNQFVMKINNIRMMGLSLEIKCEIVLVFEAWRCNHPFDFSQSSRFVLCTVDNTSKSL